MNPVDIFLMLGTTATAAGYICRMDALKAGTHRAVILAIHVGLAIITLLAVNEAFTGAHLETMQDGAIWSGWVLAVAWLLATFDQYREAPPPSAYRPETLPGAMLQRVGGARQSSCDFDGMRWPR